MTVDGHEVWLTDDPKEAFTYQKTVPVIGICTPGQDKSWSGISFLAEDWEDVDDEYAELIERVLKIGEGHDSWYYEQTLKEENYDSKN